MPRPRLVEDATLLDAAARVVAERGPHAFTLDQVAAEAGVSAPLLVQRFGSKRGLLLTLAATGRPMVEALFERARRSEGSRVEALHDALVALAGKPTRRSVANGLAFLALDITEPDFRAHALGFFDAFHEGTRALLDAGVRARELRPCDTEALARALEVAYHGTLVSWALRKESELTDALRQAVDALLAPVTK